MGTSCLYNLADFLLVALISDPVGEYVAIGNGGRSPGEDHVAVVEIFRCQTPWHGRYCGVFC